MKSFNQPINRLFCPCICCIWMLFVLIFLYICCSDCTGGGNLLQNLSSSDPDDGSMLPWTSGASDPLRNDAVGISDFFPRLLPSHRQLCQMPKLPKLPKESKICQNLVSREFGPRTESHLRQDLLEALCNSLCVEMFKL